MVRIGAAIGLWCIVLTGSHAFAESICDQIRTAQAIGLVTDDVVAASKIDAGKRLIAPMVAYDVVSVKEGDTLKGFYMAGGDFNEAYRRLLIEALNPKISEESLKEGEVVRLPKRISDGANVWTSPGMDYQRAWYDLSYDLSLPQKLKAATNDAYTQIKLAKLSSATTTKWSGLEASIADIYRVASDKVAGSQDFKSIDAQIAGVQGTYYISELVGSFGESYSDTDVASLALVAEAAVEKTKAISAGRVRITVQTKSPANKPIEGLRVFRATPISQTANCMDQTKIEFDTRSYEASGLVQIARWWIWAEDNSGHRSKPQPIALLGEEDNDKRIDLTVEWLKN